MTDEARNRTLALDESTLQPRTVRRRRSSLNSKPEQPEQTRADSYGSTSSCSTLHDKFVSVRDNSCRVPPDLEARIPRLLLFDGLPNRFPSSACSVLIPFHGDGCNFFSCIRSVPEIVSGANYSSI